MVNTGVFRREFLDIFEDVCSLQIHSDYSAAQRMSHVNIPDVFCATRYLRILD